jgi:hypothetical protein
MKRNAFALALSAAAVILAVGCGGGDLGSGSHDQTFHLEG